MILYEVTVNGQLFCIAPLSSIQTIFNLRKEALARIDQEAAKGCQLHFDRPAVWHISDIIIRRQPIEIAVNEAAEEVCR